MIARIRSEITLWRVIVAVIFVTGIYATYLRFFEGFRASTNLSDQMPWGLWVGLSTLCGIGLSAAGFGISAAVYLLGMERYRPILRGSILISFLGYMTVCVGYLYEIGLPWRFWHPIVMWNHTSVLFDVCVCIMTYTAVLTFEFAPAVIEKLPWKRFRETVLQYHHKILIGVVLAGVLLSSMHQSYLGGLYLIARGKVHPLWYSQYMHAMFYLSAISCRPGAYRNGHLPQHALVECARGFQHPQRLWTHDPVAAHRICLLQGARSDGKSGLELRLPAHQRGGILLAGDAAVRRDSHLAVELSARARQSGAVVLGVRDGGRGIHGQPAQRLHQRAAIGHGNTLRAEVDGAGFQCAGDCSGGDRVPLCRDLP